MPCSRDYIRSIRDEVTQIDCLWFVTILDDSRLRDDEVTAIRTITDAFGPAVWKRSIIIFTHADRVSEEDYEEYMEERTRIVRAAIGKHTGRSIAAAIPSVAVATDRDTGQPLPTPDGEDWMGELFVKVFARISPHAALPFVLSNARRLRTGKPRVKRQRQAAEAAAPQPIHLNEAQRTEMRTVAKSIDFGDVVQGAALAASLGFGVAGPVGAAAGAVVFGVFSLIFGD
jgi:AIG1 family